ncbi:hypothetical protein [Bradyrhizobium sp.]|uniref:hypothetical protein n=1 Tax=Bradyrhizobium sp. TaxID=376 RepID=UPI00351DB52F
MSSSALKPATELARASGMRFPNESAEYRRAREVLLAEEASPSHRARRRVAPAATTLRFVCSRGATAQSGISGAAR